MNKNDRIEVLIDHSYEEDYFLIDTVNVNLADEKEKERVDQLAKEIEGKLVDFDSIAGERIAEFLKVDVSIIDIDTNEIDIM